MGFGFKQPLVEEKRCVTTLITAAKETMRICALFLIASLVRANERALVQNVKISLKLSSIAR